MKCERQPKKKKQNKNKTRRKQGIKSSNNITTHCIMIRKINPPEGKPTRSKRKYEKPRKHIYCIVIYKNSKNRKARTTINHHFTLCGNFARECRHKSDCLRWNQAKFVELPQCDLIFNTHRLLYRKIYSANAMVFYFSLLFFFLLWKCKRNRNS